MKTLLNTVVVFLMLVGFYFTPTVSAEELAIWKTSIIKSQGIEGIKYYLRIEGASCSINAYTDGKIEIYANDFSWDKEGSSVSQYAILVPNGKVVAGNWLVKDTHSQESRGYDVFDAKFKHYAQNLPPEVREMFRGHWGIK